MKSNIKINLSTPVYIIAEISANHNGDISKALKLIDQCKKIGVNAVKIQTYEPSDITLNTSNKDFVISKKSPWKKYKNLWSLYSKAQTPFSWQKKLFDHAYKIGIDIFSSPFSERAVDLLETLNCPIYKLASPEINHVPLIERIAKTQKPILISTGMATEIDIRNAINTYKKYSKNKYILLKCNSTYPSPMNDINLNSIHYMKKKYKTIIGLSDHTIGYEIPLASVAMGAKVIEKHICLNKKNRVDGFFSLNIKEFKEMIDKIRNIELAFGKSKIIATSSKVKGGRSIYFSKNLIKGDKVTEENIKVVRPSLGLHPKFYKNILGKVINTNIKKGDRVKLEYFKKK